MPQATSRTLDTSLLVEEPHVTTTMPVAPPVADAGQGIPFNLLLCVEGLETSDGRMFELGSTSWRDLPIPFMVQDTSPHGPGQQPAPAWAAGQIEKIWRDPDDPSRILGSGHFMPNEAGQRGADILQHAFRGVSVDAYGTDPTGPILQPTAVDQAGDPLAVLVRFGEQTVHRVTMVPTPAIAPCCAWLDSEQMPAAAAAAHGSDIPNDTAPDVYDVPATNAFEHLVAAGGGPVNPPRDWFFTPEPDHYQPIEVTPDGHWTGHIAKAGQCYLGSHPCKTAPMSTTVPPYKGFHRTVAQCNDGTEVACGWLTMDTKHANRSAAVDAGQVADQYDHTGTLGAKIRCSNGAYGVWSSGAVMPGLSDRELAILQGPEVSGDWRSWQDPHDGSWHSLELLGVLGVPFPAFPGTRTRPELLVASGGEIVGQIGQILPCDDEGEPMNAAERAEFDAMADRLQTVEAQNAVLIAAAGPEVLAQLAVPPAEGAADDIAATVEGDDTVAIPVELAPDLSIPLSVSEQATYFGKYDPAARAQGAILGRAFPDGSFMIADTDDLFAAARMWKGDERTKMHLQRNADALGRTDVTFSDDDVMFAKYAADQLKDMQKKGNAMAPAKKGGDPRYPIGDASDLQNAIDAVGRGSGGHDDIRAHIVQAAKKMGKEDMIPDSWTSDGSNSQAA